MGTVIVLVVRLVVPLLILRRPLLGGLLAIVADTCDIVAFNIWGWPPWPYHLLDKALDWYYLALEALPLTPSGKVLKRALVEQAKSGAVSPVPVRYTG